MRAWLRNAPWWIWSLFHGVPFAGAMAFAFTIQSGGDSWIGATVSGVVGGFLFGIVMGPYAARQHRRQAAAIGSISASDHRAVGRAVVRGPAPADPKVRQAARRLASHQLGEIGEYQPIALSVFGLLAVLGALLTVVSSAWWWAAVALFVGLLIGQLWWPRHLRHRIELLDERQAPPASR